MSQATGNEVPGVLVALDWQTLTCQSDAGCTNRATHVVHTHALDHCNRPNLDPFGNVIDILCGDCLGRARAAALVRVNRLGRSSGAYCLTCGAPLSDPGDIIRDVRRCGFNDQPGV
ncbi:hypothetical protein OSH39_22445 [Mycobacterium ulcerans]|uniref:Uncharacterized protein n=5 Tax=Mycobacterium ulcerans group TaxID=2993898 RepID=A0A9N7LNG8_9MYCO|nr:MULTISPECIES: hypothetical protein [Mycobacterium]ULL09375.1 hypothetical protein CKW46_06265 [Mycobacterium liflandii]ABL03952.1 conserved hypothetical protein [Mycobacterium ulcerans Agy99]AGC60840.1 hypothetical protein MULP_00781 [Mycobacterium liflandii 128FXT]EPQ49514.1 hypothetical protein MMSP_5275 [Mycobacterium sp. 012931]MBC9864094.1 hypothetical protein [Mycobacterium pseudoshottsii]